MKDAKHWNMDLFATIAGNAAWDMVLIRQKEFQKKPVPSQGQQPNWLE